MLKNWIILVLSVFILAGIKIGFDAVFEATSSSDSSAGPGSVLENFNEHVAAEDGKSFGKQGQLTFELSRNGTFEIDGDSGIAIQKSDSYLDSAIIRSTESLPATYKIKVIVGGVDYGLENIRGLANDPQFSEGPQNENGCYFIAVTDEAPTGHYLNEWWHAHRKLVIDVDNNVWGHGMPNPIFMVYFNRDNTLVAYDGPSDKWQKKWRQAATYHEDDWYIVELEKTPTEYIFSISEEGGALISRGAVDISQVWHTEDEYDEYFVIGEPHINYYQGSMKIKEISITY